MIHNTVVIHNVFTVHKNSFFPGAGAVHAIADHKHDVVPFNPCACKDSYQGQQNPIFVFIGHRPGNIGNGNANGELIGGLVF